jgi:hypothetical protein
MKSREKRGRRASRAFRGGGAELSPTLVSKSSENQSSWPDQLDEEFVFVAGPALGGFSYLYEFIHVFQDPLKNDERFLLIDGEHG